MIDTKDTGKATGETDRVICEDRGIGTLTSADNERYEGEWKDGVRNGKGRLWLRSRSADVCEWR